MKKLLILLLLISGFANAQKTYWNTTAPTGSTAATVTYRVRGADSLVVPTMFINGKYYDFLTWTNFLHRYKPILGVTNGLTLTDSLRLGGTLTQNTFLQGKHSFGFGWDAGNTYLAFDPAHQTISFQTSDSTNISQNSAISSRPSSIAIASGNAAGKLSTVRTGTDSGVELYIGEPSGSNKKGIFINNANKGIGVVDTITSVGLQGSRYFTGARDGNTYTQRTLVDSLINSHSPDSATIANTYIQKLTTMNFGSYYAFGNSISVGYNGSPTYVQQLSTYVGHVAINKALSGSQAADQQDSIFVSNNPSTGNRLNTYEIYTNDASVYGTDQDKQSNAATFGLNSAAWLAIPDTKKFTAQSSTPIYTGSWSNSPFFGGAIGKYSSTNGNTITFTVSGTVAYIGYTMVDSNGGAFQVKIDGVIRDTVFAHGINNATILTQLGSSHGSAMERISGLTPGIHTILLTVISSTGIGNKAYFDWAAGNENANIIGGPMVLIGSPPNNINIRYIIPQYAKMVSDNVAMLRSDGLNVYYVNTVDPINLQTDIIADGTHPNYLGMYHIYQSYANVLNNVFNTHFAYASDVSTKNPGFYQISANTVTGSNLQIDGRPFVNRDGPDNLVIHPYKSGGTIEVQDFASGFNNQIWYNDGNVNMQGPGAVGSGLLVSNRLGNTFGYFGSIGSSKASLGSYDNILGPVPLYISELNQDTYIGGATGHVIAPNLVNYRFDLSSDPISTATGSRGDYYPGAGGLYIWTATNTVKTLPYTTTGTFSGIVTADAYNLGSAPIIRTDGSALLYQPVSTGGYKWYDSSSSLIASLSNAGVLNLNNLSASQLVATDASRNLVSITALPNGTTATTQTTGDNTTKVATDAYVLANSARRVIPSSAILVANANVGAGTGATMTIPATTDHSIQVTVVVGTLPTAGAVIGTVTLSSAMPYTPLPTFSAANNTAALLSGTSSITVTSTGNTNVTLTAGTIALPAGTYTWNINL